MKFIKTAKKIFFQFFKHEKNKIF